MLPNLIFPVMFTPLVLFKIFCWCHNSDCDCFNINYLLFSREDTIDASSSQLAFHLVYQQIDFSRYLDR